MEGETVRASVEGATMKESAEGTASLRETSHPQPQHLPSPRSSSPMLPILSTISNNMDPPRRTLLSRPPGSKTVPTRPAANGPQHPFGAMNLGGQRTALPLAALQNGSHTIDIPRSALESSRGRSSTSPPTGRTPRAPIESPLAYRQPNARKRARPIVKSDDQPDSRATTSANQPSIPSETPASTYQDEDDDPEYGTPLSGGRDSRNTAFSASLSKRRKTRVDIVFPSRLAPTRIVNGYSCTVDGSTGALVASKFKHYIVKPELQGVRVALGEANWSEYVHLMEQLADELITPETLDRHERRIFQFPEGHRKKIRKRMLDMVATRFQH